MLESSHESDIGTQEPILNEVVHSEGVIDNTERLRNMLGYDKSIFCKFDLQDALKKQAEKAAQLPEEHLSEISSV